MTNAAPLPSRRAICLVAAVGIVLAALACTPLARVQIALIAAAFGILTGAAILADAVFSRARWRRAPLRLERRLPQAFAVGAPVTIQLGLDNPAELPYAGELFDAADPSLEMPGMPLAFAVGARQRQLLEFRLLPTRRGLKRFEPAQIRLHSRLGLIDWRLRVGDTEERRVYPNFAQQAQLAWLVSDQRLGALGLAPVRRRGTGTDFDQLVEYRPGDPVRHIDWKATQKHQRPIVRRFQDERDQSVLFLLDCGRRMRADDSEQGIGATHFDQCLNAVMLLAFVALGAGDAVGAMTFGTPPGAEQSFAPRKGRRTLNALMAGLSDVEPTATFSDYERAAALASAGKRDEAQLQLQQFELQYPGFAAPAIDLGLLARAQGQLKDSEAALRSATVLDPGNATAWSELGVTLRMEGRFPDAREAYDKALAADASYSPAHRNLGVLLDLYLGEPAMALPEFERYKELSGEDKPVSSWIAELRARTGIKAAPAAPASAPVAAQTNGGPT